MTSQEIELLHETTLRILEEIGVRLEHDGVVARMLKAGAKPGAGPQDVRFPRKMVEEHLKLAPSRVTLARRDGTADALTPDSPSVFWTNPGMYLWNGKERRELSSRDLGSVARLCDNLDSVQGVMGMAMADVPPRHRDFTGVRVIAENCRRHVRALCFTPTGMEALAEMKKVFPGNWLSVGFTAHGPLRWTNLALAIFEKSAGHGIPTTINGEPMAGVTGPVTLAGAMAVGNAEILSGIVVNQVLEPGRPVIYNLGLAHTFDMKNATAVTGGPENALFARASAELGRFYDLPSSSWASTESVFDDGQAALEMTFAIHSHSYNRSSLVWGLGQLESEKTISLAQLVIHDEILAYSRRYERGFAVTPETLQYDLIRQVGIGGSFLETEHTLENFRENLWDPRISNRRARESCPGPLEEVARARAEELIAADREEKIGAAERSELLRIEKAFAARIG
ncbi:MAG TPA: trimethylamine methyltransferase family protein [Planctomycetota bacterium]|nr:trimethylamine methyltransferase family protein [Planctomycetota bacterium]